MPSVYVDSGHPVVAPTHPFKIKHFAMTHRRRRSNVLHLSPNIKPPYGTTTGNFTLETPGSDLDVSDFHYISPDKYLELENNETAETLLVPDSVSPGQTEIPVTIDHDLDAPLPITTFHKEKVII